MAKKVKNFVKSLTKSYFEGFNRLYGPCIEAGISPFI